MDKEAIISVTVLGLLAAGAAALWCYCRYRNNPARQFRITVDSSRHGYFSAHAGGLGGGHIVTSESVAGDYTREELARLAIAVTASKGPELNHGVSEIVNNPHTALLAYRQNQNRK